MNKKPRNSIDGFTLRRRQGSQLLSPASQPNNKPASEAIPDKFLKPEARTDDNTTIVQRERSETMGVAGDEAGRVKKNTIVQEIDESLKAIDQDSPKKTRRLRLNKKLVKRLVISLLIVVALITGYIGIKAILAGGSVFSGNLFDIFSSRPLKQDEYGRSNILLFGTSEDSVDHEDAGADLTDSLILLSVDQNNKNAIMFSIPRDLWVDYGQACMAGYSGKINALYDCAKEGTSDQAGADTLKRVIGEVLGIDIQYYAKVNYTALKDAVDAVGGITVVIDSDDPRGVFDPNFDWQCGATRAERIEKCPPSGSLVDYENGPANLDGVHALALARARNASGGYGLSGGNFDREQYQQKIILAIKDKAVSAGTLANPVAVAGLIDSVGKNVQTNFETGEIKTLVDLSLAINPTNVRTISLIDEDKPLVTTGSYGGQSIVRPIEGLSNFSRIQSFIRAQFSGPVEGSEDATIEVLNGTDRTGVASRKEAELQTKGIAVTSIGDAPTSSSYGAIQWFDRTGGSKPNTAQKIAEVLGQPSSGATLPEGVISVADFVIIVGQ